MLKQAKNLFKEAQKGRDILVLLHLEGCPWCHFILNEVLEPMSTLREYQKRLTIIQTKINANETLIDFDENNITSNNFASKYKIDFYPTILLFNQNGRLLEKVIGVTNKDYYWSDLDRLINKYDRI